MLLHLYHVNLIALMNMMMMMMMMMMMLYVVSAWQAKAKEARDQRRAQLTPSHNYIIGLVADNLELDTNAVEEFIIDNVRVIASPVSLHCIIYISLLWYYCRLRFSSHHIFV